MSTSLFFQIVTNCRIGDVSEELTAILELRTPEFLDFSEDICVVLYEDVYYNQDGWGDWYKITHEQADALHQASQ